MKTPIMNIMLAALTKVSLFMVMIYVAVALKKLCHPVLMQIRVVGLRVRTCIVHILETHF